MAIGERQSGLSRESLLNPALLAEARRIELRSKRNIDSETVGQFRSSFRGSGLTFSELREYEPGDDVRRIDWKATVRTGRTYVKSYQEERTLSIIVAIDCSASTYLGAPRSKHHRALEFAALITVLTRQSGDAIGMLRFSDRVEEFLRPERKRSQQSRIIASLVEERAPGATTNLVPVLSHLRQTLRKRTIVFLISDFFAPPFEEELRSLSARHDVICVHLGESQTQLLPAVGLVSVFDPESGRTMTVDSGTARGRTFLEETAKRHAESVKALCGRTNADWLALSDHPLAPLRELMSRRAKRFR